MKAVVFTTVFLVVFIVICQFFEVNLAVMSTLFIGGNLLVVFMVYNVLRDLYKTSKSFENWYEENPKKC